MQAPCVQQLLIVAAMEDSGLRDGCVAISALGYPLERMFWMDLSVLYHIFWFAA